MKEGHRIWSKLRIHVVRDSLPRNEQNRAAHIPQYVVEIPGTVCVHVVRKPIQEGLLWWLDELIR